MTDNRTTELEQSKYKPPYDSRPMRMLRHHIECDCLATRRGVLREIEDLFAIELKKRDERIAELEQAIAATLGSRRNTSLDNVDAERDAEFAKAMRRIVERNTKFGVTDIEESHIKAEELMCDLLLAHGYTETVDAFKNMRKWYG